MTKELDIKVQKLRELMRQKEELEKEIESTQDIFKTVMDALETDELKGEDWKITWKMQIRNTLDSKAIRENYPDIAEQYNKRTEFKKFLLS